MRRRTWLILLAAVVLSSALAGGFYWQWVNSPRYALQRMALALKTRNMDQFFKYVDLKAIFNDFLESSSQDQEKPPGGKQDEWSRMCRQMGNKFARSFLPKIFDRFAKEIQGVMEKYLTNLDNTQILAIAAAATTAGIEVKGDEALVTLVDPKTKEPFRFRMQRQPATETWQIVAVNYQD
ncbi:MAG TPA: hypothetical protein VIN67_09505, partial [Desulfobaccales bacterium]